VIDGELTTDHLMNACLLLGYSNADHLTSVKHMHGFRVVEINDVINSDVGCLVLENGESVGLGCGGFAKV
jgi:hypothetical protein